MKDFKFNSTKEKIFFTSDTHFWHEKIIEYCDRPFKTVEEMNEIMIENWNSLIGPEDKVFHLGDFALCGSGKYKEILRRLNGKITLIIGNHDWKNLRKGYLPLFDGVYQQLRIRVDDKVVYLNHFPFLCWDSDRTYQFFGHVHSYPGMTGADKSRLQHLQPGQFDVGQDANNFKPLEWNDILQDRRWIKCFGNR